MNSSYWPSVDEVDACIRTEAEELTDALVLAVHEPMTLTRVPYREEQHRETVTERDLLEHVIERDRPTPIVGEAGFGKSHIIRWLDIELRRHGNPSWHVVRIGKNASLRHALTALLTGLDGPAFDHARQTIDSVGTRLGTQDVAEHLVVFVAAALRDLYNEATAEMEQFRSGRIALSPEREAELKAIRRHAKEDGLPALLSDPNFKPQLVAPGKCLYQLAKRLTHGGSDEEIADGIREVQPSDLELDSHLGNLSKLARTYVSGAQLNTSDEKRREACDLVNRCLSEASQRAFQQFFQFNAGSFQDVFVEIRRHLGTAGKTLFILVEDMATISAIEDVLIDSLLQEKERQDPNHTLCALHSAIAVTTGYRGYRKRRDSIHSRGKYEWLIERAAATEQETLDRAADLCGRYLNAARHGLRHLETTFSSSESRPAWPGIWRSSDSDENAAADAFGTSPRKFPLFPYNRRAIDAMVSRYCRSGQVLEFNPRKILMNVLRDPLKSFRDKYVEGNFPVPGFANVPCPMQVQQALNRSVTAEERERAAALAAVWGNGAADLPQVASWVSPAMAAAFQLPRFAELLEKTRPIPPDRRPPVVPPRPPDGRAPSGKEPPAPVVKDIPAEVDAYFHNKAIPQDVANDIRKALVDAFKEVASEYSKWYGVKDWPPLEAGSRVLIRVEYSATNVQNCILEFGSQAEFQNSQLSLPYRAFVVAVRRRQEATVGMGCWDYRGGLDDYINYRNFLDAWLPAAAETLAARARADAAKAIVEHLKYAAPVDESVQDKSAAERLTLLTLPQDRLVEALPRTGLVTWDQFTQPYIEQWTWHQDRWLGAFCINRHAVEADLVRPLVVRQGEIAVAPKVQAAAQGAISELRPLFSQSALLDGTQNSQQFAQVLREMMRCVENAVAAGEFSGVSGVTGADYLSRLRALAESNTTWDVVKGALALLGTFEIKKVLRALRAIDAQRVRDVNGVLSIWAQFYRENLQRLKNENDARGERHKRQVLATLGSHIVRIAELLGQEEEVRS